MATQAESQAKQYLIESLQSFLLQERTRLTRIIVYSKVGHLPGVQLPQNDRETLEEFFSNLITVTNLTAQAFAYPANLRDAACLHIKYFAVSAFDRMLEEKSDNVNF